ncbi:alpha/beta hydrolase [Puniceibacterium confluentis]|uniref:alpha/beta hydrolase n=1 Tax=Puniceibacterium confluentis TaxID=1958944 RepID=UPI00356250C8
MLEPTTVFVGDLLRADLFNASADRLFVTFRQRLARPGAFDAPRPVRSFVARGYAHLHLQARWNDWYINGETAAFEAALAAVCGRYSRVVGMGFSMGGYAGLRFSAALGLKHLIAVSPQFTLSPRVLPQDRRYRDCAGGFDGALGDLASHGRRALAGAVLFDPFKPMDLLNARMIGAVFPGLALCRLAGSGHPASRVLREGGRFAALQRQLLHGRVNPAAITGLHRDSRRHSPLYWTQMAEIAGRHGRDGLAAAARARATALAPGARDA